MCLQNGSSVCLLCACVCLCVCVCVCVCVLRRELLACVKQKQWLRATDLGSVRTESWYSMAFFVFSMRWLFIVLHLMESYLPYGDKSKFFYFKYYILRWRSFKVKVQVIFRVRSCMLCVLLIESYEWKEDPGFFNILYINHLNNDNIADVGKMFKIRASDALPPCWTSKVTSIQLCQTLSRLIRVWPSTSEKEVSNEKEMNS